MSGCSGIKLSKLVQKSQQYCFYLVVQQHTVTGITWIVNKAAAKIRDQGWADPWHCMWLKNLCFKDFTYCICAYLSKDSLPCAIVLEEEVVSLDVELAGVFFFTRCPLLSQNDRTIFKAFFIPHMCLTLYRKMDAHKYPFSQIMCW